MGCPRSGRRAGGVALASLQCAVGLRAMGRVLHCQPGLRWARDEISGVAPGVRTRGQRQAGGIGASEPGRRWWGFERLDRPGDRETAGPAGRAREGSEHWSALGGADPLGGPASGNSRPRLISPWLIKTRAADDGRGAASPLPRGGSRARGISQGPRLTGSPRRMDIRRTSRDAAEGV